CVPGLTALKRLPGPASRPRAPDAFLPAGSGSSLSPPALADCSRAAEQLKNNPRHKNYLEQVSLRQLEKLFSFLRGHLWGQSLAETMEQIQRETTIDPEEDLNKLDDKELAKRKSIMDELFEKNQKKKDDPNFVYDLEVEFPQDEQLQSCGWDTESADEF
uniref:Centrosomal protein of 19 kDa n=1 Tax=Felis catus TaxID=9685 RepID=A0ABI7X9L1_FELCA